MASAYDFRDPEFGMNLKCVAQTKEFPSELDGQPERFEVHCSVHGLVFSYSVLNIRMFGEKEVQRKIDRAWVLHGANELNQ